MKYSILSKKRFWIPLGTSEIRIIPRIWNNQNKWYWILQYFFPNPLVLSEILPLPAPTPSHERCHCLGCPRSDPGRNPPTSPESYCNCSIHLSWWSGEMHHLQWEWWFLARAKTPSYYEDRRNMYGYRVELWGSKLPGVTRSLILTSSYFQEYPPPHHPHTLHRGWHLQDRWS